jgi:DNA polymerase-3 subunit alpha
MNNYVPLDVQSSYSIVKSICTIPKLVRKARELGLPALALTDDGFLFGAKEFHNECRRLGGSYGDLPSIKPVIGLSIGVAEDGVVHTIRLLAKNADGYRNLVRIASEGARFEKPADHSVDFLAVKKWHDGLICLTEETDVTFVERCLALFGDDFAFEATGNDCDFSAWPSVTVCAANPVRQLGAEDGEALDAWRAICSGTKVDELAPLAGDMPRHLMSPDEMAERFLNHPEWLENTVRLAERVESFDLNRPPAICAFPIPEGFADALDYLRHRVMEGAKTRWGDPLPKDVVARLDYELSVIGRRQMAGCDAISYLLIVADYVEAARRMGVAVGPGRGGAGGCAVAYALGITDVDPMKHGLLFERFLNPDKENLPDIDIDFDEEGVAKVLEYLVGKYGEDHVARIATFGSESPRSAIRNVARVLDVPGARGEALASLAPFYPWRQTFESVLRASEELRRIYESGNGAESRILHLAEKLCGCIRQVGVHACGFVISAEAMTDVAPVMRLDGAPVHYVTQYGGWHVEEVCLAQFDLLGLKALSDQKRCVGLIEEKTGEKIDLETIPDDDSKTFAVFADGNTDGVFQFESDGIREVLRKLKPARFSDIVAMNALYRPGVMDWLPAFIRRKNGEEPPTCPHPLMEDVLAETYGMTVYQEQVMLLAQKLAGFTPGESDTLRKALGKKKQQLIDEFREKFIAGCLANPEFRIGVWRDESAARALAEKIFQSWEKFALYAFCKSYALCYALLACRSAYLKAHWPEEFEKALRNNCALRP